MLELLRRDLTAALKARDRATAAVLRATLAAVENAQALPVDEARAVLADSAARQTGGEAPVVTAAVGAGAAEATRRHLTDDEVRAIVAREADERLSAAEAYQRAGQDEQAARLRAEAAVLRRYLDPAA